MHFTRYAAFTLRKYRPGIDYSNHNDYLKFVRLKLYHAWALEILLKTYRTEPLRAGWLCLSNRSKSPQVTAGAFYLTTLCLCSAIQYTVLDDLHLNRDGLRVVHLLR